MIDGRFGIEIEFTGVPRLAVVQALESIFRTNAVPHENTVIDNPYTYHSIMDPSGGNWSVVRDRSIRSEFYVWNKPEDLKTDFLEVNGNGVVVSDVDEYKVELVSPVLTVESLPTLLTIIEILQSLGGIVNDTTGIHIHVDSPDSAYGLLDLLQRFCLEQEEIVRLFQPESYRLDKYCKLFSDDVVDAFMCFGYEDVKKYLFIDDVLNLYMSHLRVGATEAQPHPERYYALNLSSVPKRKTIEFRFFNSSLDREEVGMMVEWVMNFCYGGVAAVASSAVN
jgi:hypothetical protein